MNEERDNQLAFIPKAAAKRARPGLEMVSEVENHFSRLKRDICNANILQYWSDSNLYATGDQLVCQFVEIIAGEKWQPRSASLPDQIRAAREFIGEENFQRYKTMMTNTMGSRRSELSAGPKGIRKTFRRIYKLDEFEKGSGESPEKAERSRLLNDGTYHRDESGIALAGDNFKSVIALVFGTLELSLVLLAWTLVVIQEHLKGLKLDNDGATNKRKMLEVGDSLKPELGHVSKAKKKVEKVTHRFRDKMTVAEAVRKTKELAANRKRHRGVVDLGALDWVPEDFAPSKGSEKDTEMEDDASSPGGDLPRLPARSESASIASKSTLPVRGLANDFETARDLKPKPAATDGAAGLIAEVQDRGGRIYPSQGESKEDPPIHDKTPPPARVKLESGLAAEDGAKTPHSSSTYSPDAMRLFIPLTHHPLAMGRQHWFAGAEGVC